MSRRSKSVVTSLAHARRSIRRARERVRRMEAQARTMCEIAERNLEVGLRSRERNVGMAHEAHELMNTTRAERERILAATLRRARWKERAILAALSLSLALLSWSAWSAIK